MQIYKKKSNKSRLKTKKSDFFIKSDYDNFIKQYYNTTFCTSPPTFTTYTPRGNDNADSQPV